MMSETTTNTKGRPDERELLDEVARHVDGIDARTLVHVFVTKGYGRYDIQRTIQRALDKGALDLGSKLRLCVVRQAA